MAKIYFDEYGVKLVLRWVDNSGTNKTPDAIFRELKREAEDYARTARAVLKAADFKTFARAFIKAEVINNATH